MMSYQEGCGGCPRIPYWSNPRIKYRGRAHRHARQRHCQSHSRAGRARFEVPLVQRESKPTTCLLQCMSQELVRSCRSEAIAPTESFRWKTDYADMCDRSCGPDRYAVRYRSKSLTASWRRPRSFGRGLHSDSPGGEAPRVPKIGDAQESPRPVDLCADGGV